MQLKGTNEEWGRIYGLLKLLSQASIAEGDRQRKASSHKLILKSLRRLNGEECIHINIKGCKISIKNDDDTFEMNRQEVVLLTELLLNKIKNNKEEILECDQVEILLDRMHIYNFVSDSLEGEDFDAIFYDENSNSNCYRKVRIKPMLNDLFLIAANRASNFKFDISTVKFATPEVYKINSIGDNETGSLARLDEISRLGGKLKFTCTEGKFFMNTLQLIDMQMPKIVSELVYQFYMSESVTIKDLTARINSVNPFKVKDELIEKSRIYEYKIRQMLYAAACGMKPTKTWRGNGYTHSWLVVNSDGSLLIYDPREKEDFEKFLFFNTRLSLPNEDQCKYGQIEKENGQWLIKLNLAIRFI